MSLRSRLARKPPGYQFTIGKILAIYSGLMVALLLAALDQTIVATALPKVVSELGGITQYSWVFTAYMLTSTVAVPVYGRLGDVHGRRPLMLIAGGSGIVPFRAMIRHRLATGSDVALRLLYSARSQEELIYHDELREAGAAEAAAARVEDARPLPLDVHRRAAADLGLEGREQLLRHPGRAQQPAALGAVLDLDSGQRVHSAGAWSGTSFCSLG